jgi:hypothetical protein
VALLCAVSGVFGSGSRASASDEVARLGTCIEHTQLGSVERARAVGLATCISARDDDARDRHHAVFISYRRHECAQSAGRLFDWLEREFGSDHVLMDLEFEPGVDFIDEIERAVGACRVFLAVIGPTWSRVVGDTGEPRLDDPHDLVRREVEVALRGTDIRVIPVLVQGARMPTAAEIPEALAPLLRLHAVTLTADTWRRDMPRLMGSIDRFLTRGS